MTESKKTVKVALGVGSNIGNASGHILRAAELLVENGFEDLRQSSLSITEPVDCVPGTPDFSNCVFTGLWGGSAEQLLNLTQSIELKLGRPEDHRSDESRVIDLDILLFAEKQLASERLMVPHPRMCERAFVLKPLNEIASDWKVPGAGFVKDILKELNN